MCREKDIFEAAWGGGSAARDKSLHILSSCTIREFDARFTAPQFGYPSVDAYYSDACMTDRLNSIRTPLLGISTEDDPFLPADGIPTEFDPEATVAMVITKNGGHVAHSEGILPFLSAPPFYASLAREFLKAVFQNAARERKDC